MTNLEIKLKPTHKVIKDYYASIGELTLLDAVKEGSVSHAFANLLTHCAKQLGFLLVQQETIKRDKKHIIVDGAIKDEFKLIRGIWEAKDSDDDLRDEIRKKFEKGYPRENIIFQSPKKAILIQDDAEVLDVDITEPENLIRALKTFFEYKKPAYETWEEAVEKFKPEIPLVAKGILELIEKERETNKNFISAFDNFAKLCRDSINPNLSPKAIEEMLIQHIMTERIFRRVFGNMEFRERNIIASEIEKVIKALTSKSFSRDQFLKGLDHFYGALEQTAATIEDYSEKQAFLNTIYEKFFQGFSVKVADTHGIVYTPQPVVEFIVESVEDILQKEFGRSLSDENVHILDPFVGTGNFIIRAMRKIKKTALQYKFENELHCNEVMLLPYYIASMNIEHEFYELTGEYKPFPGICLVDTFELAEPKMPSLFNEENTARIEQQKKSPIFVIMGNPPYNANQVNENDNNKNRKYKEIDRRVAETYAKGSKATLLNKLSDPYVKAIRWASDRIGNEGIVAFITNDSFIDQIAFDGMRKNLQKDFDTIYVLDLSGNVRKNPKLSGTTHNVFGIQVGVSINILIKKSPCVPLNKGDVAQRQGDCHIYYARVDEFWRKEQKYDFLDEKKNRSNIDWQEIVPDENHNWLTEGMCDEFKTFLPMGTKEAKKANVGEAIFKTFSLGVSTNRDMIVYDFDRMKLLKKVEQFADNYNLEVLHYIQKERPINVDDFVKYGDMKWSRNLKRHMRNGDKFEYDEKIVRKSLYRPFRKQYLAFADIIVDEQGSNGEFFPTPETEKENMVICVSGVGSSRPFHCLISNVIPDLHFTGDSQCFPFYAYDEDGTNRKENITDWAVERFRERYEGGSPHPKSFSQREKDLHPSPSGRGTEGEGKAITKLDIFYYIYGLLHHPEYRTKYAANLKRELPRIPFAEDFWAFSNAGKKLAELHLNYESADEYPLQIIEKEGEALDWKVLKMRLSKDKTQIVYNDFLTLAGIPKDAFEYKLGNRSALDWIIDQYRIKTDERSGITNDPNREDEPEYIVRLVKKIITVSLKTMEIVKTLQKLPLTSH